MNNKEKVSKKTIMRQATSLDNNTSGQVCVAKYLGSAILTNGKTGLGCLQYPLRELYSIYRSYGASMLQERRLIISLDGITMLYNDNGLEKFTHNDIGSVYDIQLLKFEQKRDKKFSGAFIPLNEKFSSKYSNLFVPLNKTYLANSHLAHPPIICIIMRRSSGIQALECHVFISTCLDNAKYIVQRVNDVCEQHRTNLTQMTKVFQYKPYTDKTNEEKSNARLFSKNQATKSQTSITSKTSSKSIFAKIKENFRSKSTKSAKESLLIDSLKSSTTSRPCTPQPLKQPSKVSISTVKSRSREIAPTSDIFYRSQSALSQTHLNETSSSFYYFTDESEDCESKFDDTASHHSNHLKWNPIKRAPESVDGSARVLCNNALIPHKDSAYNTNSSNEESTNHEERHRFKHPSAVGGVKVFPTLSNKEQSQVRRGLSEYKPKNRQHQQQQQLEQQQETSEIIDLTSRYSRKSSAGLSSSVSNMPAMPSNDHRESYQEQTNYIYYFNNEHFGGY